MDRVYHSIFQVGKAVGTGKIPLSDDLHRFKVILADLGVLFTENIEYALTGYYTHATATEQKERVLGLLDGVTAGVMSALTMRGQHG